jgi:hypothetical protein
MTGRTELTTVRGKRLVAALVCAALAAVSACARTATPVPATPRAGSSVSASFVTTSQPPEPRGGFIARPRPPESRPATLAGLPKPGTYPLPAGRTQVLGTLEYGTVTTGSSPSWWIADGYAWDSSRPLRPIVRVVMSDRDAADRAFSIEGSFVSADGVLAHGTFTPTSMWPIRSDTAAPFDWRYARTEKPNQTYLPGGRLRVVGQLAYLNGFRETVTKRWAVMLTGPLGALGTAHVAAFLDAPPNVSFPTTDYPYVAAEGTVVGHIKISGTPWPILKAGSVTKVPTEELR